MTTGSMDEVSKRFSRAGVADRWNAMYATETDRLEDFHFRMRRDLAVDLVRGIVAAAADQAAGVADATQPTILDLGCGTAPVLTELRRLGLRVIGVDYSEDMLEHARARLRSAGLEENDLAQGDCRYTPYPSAYFDVVICLGVISYVEDYDEAILEIARLLKPGGTALVSFRNSFNPLLYDPVALARYVARTLLVPVLGPRRPVAFEIGQFLDPRAVNRRIEAHGLRRSASHGIGFGPFRFNGRAVLGERRSIRLSRFLDRLFAGLSLRFAQYWLADVSLFAYRKPDVAEGSADERVAETRTSRSGPALPMRGSITA